MYLIYWIMLEPCLLQPCFHVAGKTTTVHRDPCGPKKCVSGELRIERPPFYSPLASSHHNIFPHIILSKGWVAQKPFFDRKFDGGAKIVQGLGPKRPESCAVECTSAFEP